jgi:hypothetical protein
MLCREIYILLLLLFNNNNKTYECTDPMSFRNDKLPLTYRPHLSAESRLCKNRFRGGSVPLGALTIRPPTNRPRDISTHTIRPPDKPSAVTFYYCDIPSQGGRIVRPPKIVTFRPSKFGRFVRLTVIFCPKVCDILTAYFSSNFAVTFRPNVTKGPFFPKIHQFPLTFTCDNESFKGLSHEISCFFRRSCDKTSTVC